MFMECKLTTEYKYDHGIGYHCIMTLSLDTKGDDLHPVFQDAGTYLFNEGLHAKWGGLKEVGGGGYHVGSSFRVKHMTLSGFDNWITLKANVDSIRYKTNTVLESLVSRYPKPADLFDHEHLKFDVVESRGYITVTMSAKTDIAKEYIRNKDIKFYYKSWYDMTNIIMQTKCGCDSFIAYKKAVSNIPADNSDLFYFK